MADHGGPPFPDLVAAVVAGLARFSLDRDRVEGLIAPFVNAPYRELKAAVSKLAAEEPWHVAAALLKLARSAEETKPLRVTKLARLALMAVERTRLPARFTRSFSAEAETLMGDAWRRLRQFRDAERAFARAARHLKSAGDPNQSAVYNRTLAALRVDQSRPEEALLLLERAASLFEEVGQIDDQAQALLDKVNLEERARQGRQRSSRPAISVGRVGVMR
jgi:tetratricopeptide (TPR) repeat protein